MKYTKFILTDDPNIVIGVREVKEEIHLNKLRRELREIDERLKELKTVEVRDDFPDEVRDAVERINVAVEEEKARLIERKRRDC